MKIKSYIQHLIISDFIKKYLKPYLDINFSFVTGSVTIYNNKLSEVADLENLSKLTGVCPQSNVQFDFLTVRENLRVFAKIKGIQPKEVEQEVEEYIKIDGFGNNLLLTIFFLFSYYFTL